MPTQTAPAQTATAQLVQDISQLVDKPLAYVYYNYPWGVAGTPLAQQDGPNAWQRTMLLALEEALHTHGTAVRLGVSSGNGVGKGAFLSWVIDWFVDTRPHGQGVITANTKQQLDTKTWREVAKWHRLGRTSSWKTWTATKYARVESPETWYVSAIPWSERNTEAFAGLHERHVLVGFDEASAIPDIIWDTIEGALTTEHESTVTTIIQIANGNPTRNTGRFKELFPPGRFAHRWKTLRVDSRDVPQANRAQIAQWAEDYGEESDFFKIHVRGEHPLQSELQFIGADLIRVAQQRTMQEMVWSHFPKVIGVDVGHTGSARTVITCRQGPLLHYQHVYRGKRTDEVAGLVRDAMDASQPETAFIDAIGVGAGVYDLLRHTNHHVLAVQSGARLPAYPHGKQGQAHAVGISPQPAWNKRAQMWLRCREWLEKSGHLRPGEHDELALELQAPEFTYLGEYMQICLESKEDMQARGLASPDLADALCLTFAEPVLPKTMQTRMGRGPVAKVQYAGLKWR